MFHLPSFFQGVLSSILAILFIALSIVATADNVCQNNFKTNCELIWTPKEEKH